MITAVVLTRNDEEKIHACLNSLSWCDEVVVVDDDSTDKTVEISKKLGAKIYVRSLNNDFAAQRNFGVGKAKHEWVLFIDSDEVVTKELATEVQAQNTPGVSGYYLKRNDCMWGRELKHGETAHVKLLRFAKKNKGEWTRPVHETWNITGIVGELKHPILHYPHSDVAQFVEEVQRYSTINAKHFFKTRVRTNIAQIVLFPMAKFFVNYIWRLGFLDGMPGALVAFMMSFHSFLTRSKLWHLSHEQRKT